MIFSGEVISVEALPSGFANLKFDLKDSSVNKLDRKTLMELQQAVTQLASNPVPGLVISSAKSGFIVGADIMEFTAMFHSSADVIKSWLIKANQMFSAIEDLPFPTVTAIRGMALGGGMELAVATDYRVATEDSRVGFPEVKLGIIPGFGGTVRLPRLIGADNANQWISSGAQIDASQAFNEGALDAVVADELLIDAAEKILQQCQSGKLDYQKIRQRKKSPLLLTAIELNVAFETALGLVAQKAGPHYPAPVSAVKTMYKAASLQRDEALLLEHEAFVKLATGDVAGNLVQIFINDQYLGGMAKKLKALATDVKSSAVLGAGIMGGGIAYQAALRGIPVIMKDIAQEGLDLGMAEAKKQLAKRVKRGKLQVEEMYEALGRITPSLEYATIEKADVIVEAVVENPAIKKQVLSEVENLVSSETILTTNTSTISVDILAEGLKRPEKFCGMHFFNPVPIMPLVEVIKGSKTDASTLATVVQFAKNLGKTPIVVEDCPGFLVNRILFPYFSAFSLLLRDGADFQQIDRIMEKFGWPMGPAYLLDVIGIDTGVHAQQVMAQGFPERMALNFKSVMDVLFENQRLGQKSSSGFYRYELDKRGKPKKIVDPEVIPLVNSVIKDRQEIEDQDILQRMMIAMCLEAARCLEDQIVKSPIEVDMGLVLGLGFPAFRGGALRYIDSIGAAEFCNQADKYGKIAPLYEVPQSLRQLAKVGGKYYQLPAEKQEAES